jgi:hypothetical protein
MIRQLVLGSFQLPSVLLLQLFSLLDLLLQVVCCTQGLALSGQR